MTDATKSQREALMKRISDITAWTNSDEFLNQDLYQIKFHADCLVDHFTSLKQINDNVASDTSAIEERKVLWTEYYVLEEKYLNARAKIMQRLVELTTAVQCEQGLRGVVDGHPITDQGQQSFMQAPVQSREAVGCATTMNPNQYAHRSPAFAHQVQQPTSGRAKVYVCRFCYQSDHKVGDCLLFRSLSLDQRYKIVHSNKLCMNCLKKGHYKESCWDSTRCQMPQCAGSNVHHRFLCPVKNQMQHAATATNNERPPKLANIMNTASSYSNMDRSHGNPFKHMSGGNGNRLSRSKRRKLNKRSRVKKENRVQVLD